MLYDLERGNKGYVLDVYYHVDGDHCLEVRDVRLFDTIKQKEHGPNVLELLTPEELADIERGAWREFDLDQEIKRLSYRRGQDW